MAEKKTKTIVVRGTVTEEQAEALDLLIGDIGSTRQDVVGKLLTMWLYNDGIIKQVNRNRHQK